MSVVSILGNVIVALVGILAATALVMFTRRFSDDAQRRVLAIGLGVAACVYIVFAVAAGGGEWITVEILVAVTFVVMAFSTVQSHLLLGIAWTLHVGWDVIHIAFMQSVIAPIWYPPLCIAFDMAIAVYLLRVGLRQIRRSTG